MQVINLGRCTDIIDMQKNNVLKETIFCYILPWTFISQVKSPQGKILNSIIYYCCPIKVHAKIDSIKIGG